MTLSVLFAGDVGVDLTLVVPHAPGPDEKVLASSVGRDAGGVTTNAAVACARAGVRARALVCTGTDDTATQAVDALARHGVHVEAASRPGATCLAVITLAPPGEKRLVLVPGVSMYPTIDQVHQVELNHVLWVHTALYDPTAGSILAGRCRAAAIPFSVDLEPATLGGGLARLTECLRGAHTVLVNLQAAALLGVDPVAALYKLGVAEVILTLGSRGVALHRRCSEVAYMASPSNAPPVVDTTGAGDALAGWYAARRSRGADAHSALAEAVAAASLSCAAVGAQASYPYRQQVLSLLASDPNTPQPLERKAH